MNLFNSESWDGGYYDAIWKDFKKNYFEEEIGLLDTSNCCRREGKQRVDYFLTAIGPGAREEYEKLNFDKAEDKNDLLKVIEKFNQNCKPVATIIGQRLENQKFTECKQEVGESFKDKSEDPEDKLVKELVEGLRNETKTSLGNMIHIREIECDPMALQALVQEAKNIQKTQGEELKVKLLKKRDQLKAEKQTKAKNMDIKEKQTNLKDVELKGANSKHEKETMSSRPKYMLTENGIINLFEPSKKTNTSVQVIFLVCTDMVCYLRVSDGKNVSPVVLMVKKQYSPVFNVGAVITVKEVRLAPNDLRESKGFSLKDAGLHPFLIHSYNLVDDSNTVGTVIGNLNNSASYKDALKIVAPQLKKYNPDFATYVRLDAATTKTLQEDSDVLRKRGNAFYNKHNYNDAIDHYEMAKEKNPYDHRTWANRSQAYYNCSDFVQAEQDAILAIKMNPFYEKAYYWASKAALEQTKFKEAEVYAECGLFLCSSKVKIEYNKELQDLLALAKSKARNSSFCGFEKSLSAKAGIAHCVASVSASVSSTTNEKGINGSFSISLFGNVNGNTDKEKKDLKGNEKKGKQMRPKKAQNHQVDGDEYSSACSDDDDYDGLKKSSEEEKKRNKSNERSCKNGIVPRNLEKDKQQNKEVLGTTEPEKEAKPEDIYQDAMRTGKRFYELGEYRQAMEAFGKGEAHLEAFAKKSDGFRKLAKNGKAEGQVIQFIVGMCKIHFGKSFILDGMEIMKGLTERGSIFPSRPAAHYWLCFGYEKIFLFKLAYDHAIACGEAIKENPDFRPIKWPGTNENIRDTVPDTLKAEHKAALNKNMDSLAVPEEDALRMWNSLNVSGLTKRLENIQEFYEKQKLAERLIYFQICRSSQDVSKLSRGDLSFNKSLCNGNILEKESSVKSILKAKCRYKKCLSTQGHKFATEEIYLTDPDFKGYLDIFCEDSCTVSYHPCCWKAFKEDSESRYGRMADKEFLGTDCLTPDCSGKICTIHIYDETGKRKNELAKDKKEKKNAPLIKQKKKKDKKKEKPQAPKTGDVRDKRKSKHDSISEDTTTTPTEEPSIKKDIVEDAARVSDKERLMAAANLPIDPDSLDSSQITILKPVIEVESAPTKNAKKKKKNKKSKVTTMPELLGDPLEAETAVQNEYLNRLRVLRQQRDAQEGVNAAQPQATVTSESSGYMSIPKVLEWLDPANPFYLPHHLRDNPSELETILQTKMIASTSPDLQQSTIVTLLDFMYEWLKSEGPMSVNDARLREYVTENFPLEAQTHVNSCGGIKPFLMQSINFAMIDDIICVRDHVVQAQEMILRTVTERMNSSKFLISDGRKAKKFTHLLEDTKSTCSSASASSTSLLAGSSVSHTSTLSTNKAQKEEVNNKKAVDIHHNISSSNSHTDSELSADHKLNPLAPSFEDKTYNEEKNRTLSGSAVTSGNYEVNDDPADNADELYASDEEEMDEEEEEEIQESDAIEELYARIRELEVSVSQEQEQNQLLSDKLVQIKSQSSLEISTLRREIDDHKEREKVLEAEKLNLMTLRENDAKKVKSDMSRIQDEMKMYQNRNQSLEVAYERSNDRFNELNAKVAEEQELNAQLKEEVKNLQESLTSSSRRAHEAEVKYLSIKKDLGEAYLVKTIDRLLEETARMRQLLPFATEDTIPDRATLSRSIIAWDENIKGLRDRKGAFMEEGARLLGMVNQGRPLNALPPGDLEVPTVPDISVAPLLCLGQRGVSTSKSATPVPDSCQERGSVSSSASSQLPPVTSVGLLSLGPTIGGPQLGVTAAELEANPLFVRNGATAAAFNSGGAIPKGGIVKGPIPKVVHPTTTTTQPTTPPASESPIGKKWPDSHQIFVGQIPWDYGETELKNLFSSLFGEVVSVIIHDKGRTAEGKPVPKFGFVTFRNAEDCAKVLTGPAVSINKHTLNIQRKESKKTTKPTTAAVVSLSGNISDPVSISSSQSAYGLSDISLNASAEASKSTVRSLNTPTLNPPSTPTVTKPKFQNLTSSSSVGAIGTLPPKLVRPQPRLPVVSNPKGVSQNVASKEDNVVTSASYKRLIETCKQRLGKEYASHEICAALKEVRHRNNNSLSGLNVDMIVERVKAQMPSRRPGSGQASVAPWAGITQGSVPGGVGPEWQGPAGEEGGPPIEEQCSICLDLLASSPTVPLQCQHVFHEKCIKDWLKRQSNCPNCRTFALMTDEYPSLTHA